MPVERKYINPGARGHSQVYRENQSNHCPGCGRSHWIIGRITAECAFCSTAIPIEVTNVVSTAIWKRGPKPRGR